MKKDIQSEVAMLRKKAEDVAKKRFSAADLLPSATEILKLIHELEVHQIELELINEELMLASSAAQDAAEKYTELYDFAPSDYFTLSKEGKIIELNLSGAKMLGNERSRIKNRQFDFFVSNDTKPIFNLFLEKVFNSKATESCEVILSVNDNLAIYVQLTGIATKNGEQCLVTVIEIIERKRAEQELIIADKELVFQKEEKKKRPAVLIIADKELTFQSKEKENRAAELIIANKELLQSEENFHRSISESPLGIRIVTVDGKTIYANKAFLDIFEFNSMEEFTSTPAINRYTPKSYAQHQERKEKRKNGQEAFDYEVSIIRKNAEIRHVKVSRKEVLWNGIKHYQLINQDITEQKKLTLDLIEAKEHAEQSDRLKSAFLANMSHEIRTPMNGILGFAGLLKKPGRTGEDQQEYIKIIEKSGARMLNIINDIVDISKIESGLMKVNVKESNVNEQIEYIYTFFKPEVEGKGMQLSYRNGLVSSESIIKTDREKLFAILTNLIKNAIKFSNKGSIECGYDLVKTQHATSLQFFVKDTGIGIPKDRQKAIFDRFVQADIGDKRAFQGAGLGLSISKAYVEMLGGRIWVESEEGKGSTFYFTIPYNTEPEEKIVVENIVSADEAENKVDTKTSGLKILIAEDDENSTRFIAMTVKKFSKEVLYASTGVDAIEACRNNPDIDLVLMDIKMPEMDGYEATRQIRQFNKDVVIIAQTAYALIGDREKAIEAGCNDYISKPIKKDELMGLVQKYFNK